METTPSAVAPATTEDVVICAADEHYALPLAVMLESLLKNANPAETLDVFIVDCGLSQASREGLGSLFRKESRANFHAHWLVSRRSADLSHPRWGHVSGVTYERLLLADYLPGGVRSATWLDGDLLVLDGINALLQANDDHAVLQAVRDPFVPLVSSPFGVTHWQQLGMAEDTPYFNAGVMRVNMARWRETDMAQRAMQYLDTYGRSVFFYEQEALNAVIGQSWTALDDRWNMSANPMHARLQSPCGAPAVLHFAGRVKPWEIPGLGGIQTAYFRYLDNTPWRGQRPKSSALTRLISWYVNSNLRRATYGLENLHLRLKHFRGH